MTAALWIVQGLLALVFAVSGFCKGTYSKERLVEIGQTGVVFFPVWAIRLIASAEVAAAVALLVPAIVDRGEALTVAASVGLCLLMIGAALTHARLREPRTSRSTRC